MLNVVVNFFDNHLWAKIILDAYLLFIVVYVVLKYILKNKKAFDLAIINLIVYGIARFSKHLQLEVSAQLFSYISYVMPIIILMILMPDIRKAVSANSKGDLKSDIFDSSNQGTKNAIAEAVIFLASKKIGALITVEKHISLDQYSERAIQLNSEVSKELLINIFTPLTPLHDGGVIIRGNKIRCAGAYYVLAQKDDLDKTTGSRHRAGLGISEVSDSLTIIVSEETGNISLAIEGMLIKSNDKEKILEYLDMFLR